MCIIIDANCRDEFFSASPSEAARPILAQVMAGKLSIVIGGLLTDELEGSTLAKRQLAEWRRVGKVRLPVTSLLQDEMALVAGMTLASNDAHIIALARASGARTLFTRDGKTKGALVSDFKNKALIDNPRGHVYTLPRHSHLLKHTKSCGQLGQK